LDWGWVELLNNNKQEPLPDEKNRMSIPNFIHSICRDIQRGLAKSAVDYANLGLQKFHTTWSPSAADDQVIIGTLAVSVEFMIKTLLAKYDICLLYLDIPLELKLAFHILEKMPEKVPWKLYEYQLKSSNYKTIGLPECITYFGILFPEQKQKLGSHLRFLERTRNLALHSTLPPFRQYELHRTIYLTLCIFNALLEREPKLFHNYKLTDDEKNHIFLSSFDDLRVDRVHKAIEAARLKANSISGEKTTISVDDWNMIVIECPICGNDALLVGYLHDDWECDEHGLNDKLSLTFLADSLECEFCGLKLEDAKELDLGGINLVWDRSELADRWIEEQNRSES
jgi:hypothetical protein